MQSFNLSLKKLLLRNIWKIKNEELERVEGLLALRSELAHQKTILINLKKMEHTFQFYMKPDPQERLKLRVEKLRANIIKATEQAREIIKPFGQRLEALNNIWTSRRNVAHSRGNLLQIPATVNGVKHYAKATWDYRWNQLSNFGTVFKGKINDLKEYILQNKIASIAILILSIILGYGFEFTINYLSVIAVK